MRDTSTKYYQIAGDIFQARRYYLKQRCVRAELNETTACRKFVAYCKPQILPSPP